MKTILVACIACFVIALPARSELTQQDLDKIRLLIHEAHEPIKTEIASIKTEITSMKTEITSMKTEITSMKTEIVSVKNEVSWIRGRIEGIDKQITHVANLSYGLIALIVVAVGIPQIIMVWRGRQELTLERRVEELVRQNAEMAAAIETLKQQRIVSP